MSKKSAIAEQRFAALLEENYGALSRLAASYTRNPADRDDLVQDILLSMWRALPSFRGECSERTFLFRIAHNRCITHVTRSRHNISLDDLEAEPVDPGMSTERQLAESQERGRLLAAVRELQPIYREVVVLLLEGFDYKEISRIVGISKTNVGVRLNRARHLLRAHMEKQS
jgi:RNA polymerase sigma-70 factor (ECF subfamily)